MLTPDARARPSFLLAVLILISVGGSPGASVATPLPSPNRALDSALTAYEDGYRLYRAGDLRGAERRLLAALSAEPNLLKAHYWLGKVYREQGHLKKALFHWEEVLRLQELIRQRRLALTVRDNEYPAASQIAATRERKKQAVAAWRKGRGLLEGGHWAGAQAELERAVKLYPGHPEYLKLLARILWDRADLRAAAGAYADLLALPHLSRELALEAVDRLILAGDRQTVRRNLRELLERFPGDACLQERLRSLEQVPREEPVAAGRVVRVQGGQAIVDLGLENGLKLADEYTLRFRAFRPGAHVTDPRTGRSLGRAPDRTSGELLVTKVLSRSSWVLVQREFDRGVQEGDLVEVQSSGGR